MIFNAILRIEYFPKQWKNARISMILKPGKPEQDPSSYRPISLLPSLSKVFERQYISRLLEYMDANKTIPLHQFGFRSGHSTVEQLHRVVNNILKAFD